MSNDDKSLAHTRWNCKYHLVFTPKYRRKVIYGQLRRDIGKILRKLCEMKEVEIIEAHAMPDHIHMLVRIPPKLSVSGFMGFLKGRSAVIIHERHANLKYNYGNRSLLVKRLLCEHCRTEPKNDSKVYTRTRSRKSSKG